MIRNLFLSGVMAITLFSLSSCCGNSAKMISDGVSYRVIQDRVIELTYDKFDMEASASYLSKYDPTLVKMGGCSAVKLNLNGKWYVGRNYDFYCSEAPAVIVRNNAGQYKTIGICNSPMSFEKWTGGEFTIRPEVLPAVPFLCCDVMNEAGLYAETNIRTYEEQFACNSTNPGKPRRCAQTFMQTMLSNYGTLKEIEEHIDDYDWFDLQLIGFEQSFFITDQEGQSILVEFAADTYKVTKDIDYNANHFVYDEWYSKEEFPMGELRIQKEKEYLPNVKTEDDIFTMMRQGAYDQFYQADIDLEYALPEYSVLGPDGGYKKSYYTSPEHHSEVLDFVKEKVNEFSGYSWEQRVEESTWESTFIEAVNVTDQIFNVILSEHYNIAFSFGF